MCASMDNSSTNVSTKKAKANSTKKMCIKRAGRKRGCQLVRCVICTEAMKTGGGQLIETGVRITAHSGVSLGASVIEFKKSSVLRAHEECSEPFGGKPVVNELEIGSLHCNRDGTLLQNRTQGAKRCRTHGTHRGVPVAPDTSGANALHRHS